MRLLSKRRRLTLKDLARHSGITPTAVSYVLNDRLDRVRVSPETKQRVLAIAKEMGAANQVKSSPDCGESLCRKPRQDASIRGGSIWCG
ncbi:MAG TPA: LacI family DNA-binding transcriptional regulator [Tepidisphaeraceae bacterium]|jgi:transcriptional regulator with XRE-family HTH domain